MARNHERRSSVFMEAFSFMELVYHTIVRQVRTVSGNATLGLLSAVFQVIFMVAIFYAMYSFLGLKSVLIRGDMVLFIITGVMLFLMHNNTISKTIAAGSAVSPMMQHAPMTPSLMIIASTLSTLYLNILAVIIILSGFYLVRGHLEIHDISGTFVPFLLAWASGVVIGLLFLLVKPFAPKLMQAVSMGYRRANMITSGKLFLANMLPLSVLPYFTWNPLFHAIDQLRGAVFVNYFPNKTSLDYPIWFVFVGLILGLMGEFWLRRTVSRSTGAAH